MPKIQNLGRKVGDKHIARKIVFPAAWDKDGRPLAAKEGKGNEEIILKPNQHKEVTDEQFKHLKENFGSEIINLDDNFEMQKAIDQPEKSKERPEGYLSPDEVEAKVQARVKEELQKRLNADETESNLKIKNLDDDFIDTSDRTTLAKKIDGLDRLQLIALIEKEDLNVEHKNFKNPNALKSAILSAFETKEAAKSAA